MENLPTGTVEEVGPDLAAEWLKLVPRRQRRASLSTIAKYAADMEADMWNYDGSPVRFNEDGGLVDGQQRMAAVVKSGKTVPFLVIRGLSDVFDNIDTNRPRTFSDQLYSREIAYHRNVASIDRRLWLWDGGYYGIRGVSRVHVPRVNPAVTPSIGMLKKVHEENPSSVMGAEIGAMLSRLRGGIGASWYGLLWVLVTRLAESNGDSSRWVLDEREKFFQRFRDGVGLEAENPILVLHRQLALTRGQGRREVVAEVKQAVWLFKCWNAFIRNESTSALRMVAPVRWDLLPIPTLPGMPETPMGDGWEDGWQ